MKESCLYIGEIEHQRFSPVKNKFKYSVCYYYLDLEKLPQIFRYPFILSLNFPGILSFWRKDYYGDAAISIKEAVHQLIYKATGETFRGPIRLLTNISYLGYCFNPVSFYYCFEEDGTTLKYIVSEVTNTPWRERHQQVMKFQNDDHAVFQFPKNFHVSPFMPMSIDYTWVFKKPAKEIYVLMQNRNTGENAIIFDSTLKLKMIPLTTRNIFRTFFVFPMNSLKTMLAIYFQALKLYLLKSPIYSHQTPRKDYDISNSI